MANFGCWLAARGRGAFASRGELWTRRGANTAKVKAPGCAKLCSFFRLVLWFRFPLACPPLFRPALASLGSRVARRVGVCTATEVVHAIALYEDGAYATRKPALTTARCPHVRIAREQTRCEQRADRGAASSDQDGRLDGVGPTAEIVRPVALHEDRKRTARQTARPASDDHSSRTRGKSGLSGRRRGSGGGRP